MQRKEVCWNITTKCNQNCRYCHRFLAIFTYLIRHSIRNDVLESAVLEAIKMQ